MRMVLTGNHCAAYGAKLSRARVVAAYPITPQTTIVEKIASMVASGEFETEYIPVESEHSAMAACVAAEMMGSRSFTATSSHGLAYMHEMLHWATGMRAPVVMAVVNRALGPPWNIWVEHTDALSQRDTGWIQIFCESNQELLDTVIMAYRVAEERGVLLPVMVNIDAFYLSHTVENVEIPDQKVVDSFLPPFDPPFKLDVENPMGFGHLIMPDRWMELRYAIDRSMDRAKGAIDRAQADFGELFGRSYSRIEPYRCEGAERVVVGMGTMMTTAREAIDSLREKGERVGLIKIRTFRPFPGDELLELIDGEGIERIGVMDRSTSFGSDSPLFSEFKGALYGRSDVVVNGYVIGLGGREIRAGDVISILDDLKLGRELREKWWGGLEGEYAR
jgi:pyruvate/2-oxoacid:ferredoxin oxidoreductase alpha subunit